MELYLKNIFQKPKPIFQHIFEDSINSPLKYIYAEVDVEDHPDFMFSIPISPSASLVTHAKSLSSAVSQV